MIEKGCYDMYFAAEAVPVGYDETCFRLLRCCLSYAKILFLFHILLTKPNPF